MIADHGFPWFSPNDPLALAQVIGALLAAAIFQMDGLSGEALPDMLMLTYML